MPGPILDRGFFDAIRRGLLVPRVPRRPRLKPPPPAGRTPFSHVEPPLELTMLPSAERSIERIVFSIPAPVLGDTGPVGQRLQRAYDSIFRGLPERCHVVVLTREGALATAEAWLDAAGVGASRRDVVSVDQAKRTTMWTNDPFWTCTRLDDPLAPHVLVEPNEFHRNRDDMLADDLKSTLGYGNLRLARYFEGGNLLVGDDFYLVGIDSVADLTGPLAVTSALGPMESVRRPIVVGGSAGLAPPPTPWHETLDGAGWQVRPLGRAAGSQQPIFHIDMYVTLVGRGIGGDDRFTVLVGDPDLATPLMGGPTWPAGSDPTQSEAFTAVAIQLEQLGLRVLRTPLPVVYEDDTVNKTRSYYYASYNNAIVQRGPDRVLLPSYGNEGGRDMTPVDDHVEAQWRELGFEVVRLAEMNAFAVAGGAANCLKNVLARGFDPMR